MSVQCTTRVWKQSETTGTHRLVLLAIADFANEDGVGWPGQKRLAEMAKVSVGSIKRITTDLVNQGELWKGRRRKGGPNAYIVLLGLESEELERAIKLVSDLGCKEKDVRESIKREPGITPDTTLVSPLIPPGITAMTPDPLVTVKEPSSSAGAVEDFSVVEYVDLDETGYPSKKVHPLIKFIQSKGRKLTPNQQDKLSQGVPYHNPQYPSPTSLFEKDPLFRDYVQEKINWATGGIDGKRKTTGSMIASIRNYETEKFGWLDWRQENVEGKELKGTTHTPLPPGWEAQEKPDYISPEEAYALVEDMGARFPPETLEKMMAGWKKRGLEWDETRLKEGSARND